jgi:hypothetical protein
MIEIPESGHEALGDSIASWYEELSLHIDAASIVVAIRIRCLFHRRRRCGLGGLGRRSNRGLSGCRDRIKVQSGGGNTGYRHNLYLSFETQISSSLQYKVSTDFPATLEFVFDPTPIAWDLTQVDKCLLLCHSSVCVAKCRRKVPPSWRQG